MSEKLELRTYGEVHLPTLIYLPGLHGDWTLIGGFRRALENRVRFVEATYPRTLTWGLEEYAEGVESALAEQSIKHAWLLGESFSSQVVWPMVRRKKFLVDGVILAGGFVRHPMEWGVRIAEKICGGIPLRLLVCVLFWYAKIARIRFRKSPETRNGIEDFIARRTELDRQAATHRLQLIASSDPRSCAKELSVPLYALTGLFDPIVPWPWVRAWLKKNCPALREYRIVRMADHNVLSTAPSKAADLIVGWMRGSQSE